MSIVTSFEKNRMLRLIFLIGIMSVSFFQVFSQIEAKTEEFMNDLDCLSSIIFKGAEIGYWDTLNISDSFDKECLELCEKMKFEIAGDTLSIVRIEDLHLDPFIGIKAVIQPNETVYAYVHLKDFISGKSGKRKKKKFDELESSNPLGLEFKKEGETQSVGFISP